MIRIGIASADITPGRSVWLTGYGHRDHKSEGVYQALLAGAIALKGDADEILILTADHIGYGPACCAEAKMRIAEALPGATIDVTGGGGHTSPSPWKPANSKARTRSPSNGSSIAPSKI